MRLGLLLLFAASAFSATFEESFRAGLLALQRNDLSAAQTNLEAAAKLEPGNGRVWVALSQTYRKLKEGSKAEAAAAKAETLGRTDPMVQSTLALYYAEGGQPLKAAEAQARYSSLVPQDAAARERAESLYFEVTQPLLQQGKFAEAIPILKGATEMLKGSAQLELALGWRATDCGVSTMRLERSCGRSRLHRGRNSLMCSWGSFWTRFQRGYQRLHGGLSSTRRPTPRAPWDIFCMPRR